MKESVRRISKMIIAMTIAIPLSFGSMFCGGGGSSEGGGAGDAGGKIVSQKVTAQAGYTSIKLTWESFGTGYQIHRSEENGSFVYMGSEWGDNAYEDFDVEIGKRYQYKITNDTADKETAPTDEVTIKPVEVAEDLTVAPDGYARIKIDFTIIPANKENTVNYYVYRSIDQETFKSVGSSTIYAYDYNPGEKISITDWDVDISQTYYYKVICKLNYSEGNSSTTEVKMTTISPPPAPGGFNLDTTTGQMKLGWTAVDRVEGYAIYRSEDNVDFTKIASVFYTKPTTYIDDSCGPDTTYYYKIAAYVGTTESDLTDQVNGSIVTGSFAPVKPSAKSGTLLEISWTGIQGIDNYRLYRSESDTGLYSQIGGDLSSSTVKYTDASAVNEKNYYYKLAVVKGGAESQKSEWVTGKKVKYGRDIYEDDDYSWTAKAVNVYTSITQTHTLDNEDGMFGSDYYIIYNKSSAAKYVKVTFTGLDLNGNTSIKISSGYDSIDIKNIGDSVQSASKVAVGNGWTCQIYRMQNNTAQYTVKFELVN